jgi:toxin ParE1/3/4
MPSEWTHYRPDIGRTRDEISPGMRRLESGRHVVYFREASAGVRIVRILHQRMLPEGHMFEE